MACRKRGSKALPAESFFFLGLPQRRVIEAKMLSTFPFRFLSNIFKFSYLLEYLVMVSQARSPDRFTDKVCRVYSVINFILSSQAPKKADEDKAILAHDR
jgi:hypothetical protein